MRHNWANTILLVLILVELATGLFGLVSGSRDKAAYILSHRISGYAILVVLLWKVQNALFSLRRRRAAGPRAATLVLTAVLALTLGLGFAWSFSGPFAFAGFSGVSWHIYVGAAMLPLLVWHSAYHTRGLSIGVSAERRSFLQLGAVAIAGAAFWQLGELGARLATLSGATRRFTGSYGVDARTAGVFPVVSWLNDRPPGVGPDSWALRVRGAVEHESELSYEELDPRAELTATIDCTGGWYSTQVWRGVPLAVVLETAGVHPDAASVTVTSVTGYYRRFSLEESRGYLLATHVGGRPLSRGHGSPLRLVAPGKRGFEWVKWVAAIEVNSSSKWLQPPLPLQ